MLRNIDVNGLEARWVEIMNHTERNVNNTLLQNSANYTEGWKEKYRVSWDKGRTLAYSLVVFYAITNYYILQRNKLFITTTILF